MQPDDVEELLRSLAEIRNELEGIKKEIHAIRMENY
jgi:hypothetical protein